MPAHEPIGEQPVKIRLPKLINVLSLKNMFQIGQFVEFDGLLAVVIEQGGKNNVPDDHIALWFGEPQGKRKSEGRHGELTPEVWTVPADLCFPAKKPDVRH